MGLFPGGAVPIHDHSSTGQGGTVPRSVAIPSTDQAALFAWVNFNGTGVIAINGSYNVASLNDNGVGDYTINFSTAQASANYAIAGAANEGTVATTVGPQSSTALQVGSCRVLMTNYNSAANDSNPVCVIVTKG
jgi:hypothetical protein